MRVTVTIEVSNTPSIDNVKKIVETQLENSILDCLVCDVVEDKTIENTRDKIIERRLEAGNILSSNKMESDEKLFKIFQMYKDDLKRQYTQFYYAMLEWKNAHFDYLLDKGCIKYPF